MHWDDMTPEQRAEHTAAQAIGGLQESRRQARERLHEYARSLIAADFPTLTVEQLKDVHACLVTGARSAKLERAAAVYVRARDLHQSIGSMDTATAQEFDPATAGGWPA